MGKGLSGISKAIKVFSENAIYTEAKIKTPRGSVKKFVS